MIYRELFEILPYKHKAKIWAFYIEKYPILSDNRCIFIMLH